MCCEITARGRRRDSSRGLGAKGHLLKACKSFMCTHRHLLLLLTLQYPVRWTEQQLQGDLPNNRNIQTKKSFMFTTAVSKLQDGLLLYGDERFQTV